MIRVNRIYIYLFLFVFFMKSNADAQFFLPKDKKENLQLPDLEKAFNDWAKGKDLNKIKGWKYYKRWESEMMQRLNPDGSLPDQRILFEEAVKITEQKKSSSDNSSGWIPVGPFSLNPVFNYETDWQGRTNTVAFHPTDPKTIFAGVAQGGIWKSTDNGNNWTPVNEGLPILRVSDIAIDPNNPDTMYVCLGDFAYIGFGLNLNDRKRNTHYGLGIYKSTDGGASWNPTGLTALQTSYDNSLFCRIFINPKNSNELVTAGVSGIYKSFDAGASWTHVNTDLIWDIEQDKHNSNVFYASSGYVYNLQKGNAGIMKSLDFGNTWAPLQTGIPATYAVQRIEIASSPADSNYVYAVACGIDLGFYGFYKSTNAGLTWTQESNSDSAGNILGYSLNQPGGQGAYDLAIVADPTNKDKVYIGGIYLYGTNDGGKKWSYVYANVKPNVSEIGGLHPDQHFLSYNPLNKYFYLANDGGLYKMDSISLRYDTPMEFISSGMNITSFYRLGLSKNHPGYIVAGAQDNNSFYYNNSYWTKIFSGDGMECMLDHNDSSLVYGSYQYGTIMRSSQGGINENYISPDANGEWVTPMIMDSKNSNRILAAYGQVYESLDQGNNWTAISHFDPVPSTGFPLNSSAIALSENNPKVIYLAKRLLFSQGQPSQVYVTKNNGQSWINITKGLPDSLYFTYLAVDGFDPNIAWISCSGFVAGTKVFKTNDGGKTWKNISFNLPNIPVNCVVHQEGSLSNIVYVATDLGVYYLTDSKNEWYLFSKNLPNVIVDELEIHPLSKKIYAATFGSAIWMSDLAPDNDLGVQHNAWADLKISLSPNPNSGSFLIALDQIHTPIESMDIVNVQGRTIFHEDIQVAGNFWEKKYNLKLNSGMYFLKLSGDNHNLVRRFIIE